MFTRLTSSEFRLFLISILSLYFEIVLIRWVSVEIRIFAYFKNLTLIACFLGLGLGCLRAHRPISLLWSLVSMTVLAFCVNPHFLPGRIFQTLTRLLGGFEDSPIWAVESVSALWSLPGAILINSLSLVLLLALFCLIACTFIPMGNLIARLLSTANQPLRAYSIHIVGNLMGVGIFSVVCAYYSVPPVYWFIPAMALLFLLVEQNPVHLSVGIVSICIAFFLIHEKSRQNQIVIWSPYQKLVLMPMTDLLPMGDPLHPGYVIEVNRTYYQSIMNLSAEVKKAVPDFFPADSTAYDHYDVPYLFSESPKDVLIVGAGAGNDVAGALRHGVESVDAVEIDPMIVELGRKWHPERPYRSERVNVIIDDARAFFKKTDKQYDLIIFGLLDAHTLGSPYTNIRIDHYVYTSESFAAARQLLKPGGVLALSFSVPHPWMGGRIRKTLEQVFGSAPICFKNLPPLYRGTGGTFFVVGDRPALEKILAAKPNLKQFIEKHSVAFDVGDISPTTDDWPYLYLKQRSIPWLYRVVGFSLILLTCLFMGRSFAGGGFVEWHFFFLGAGFLLMEVQAVSRIALIWGSTWQVNSIVISAILLMILSGNFFVIKAFPVKTSVWYSVLGVSIGINWFVPLDVFFNIQSGFLRGCFAGGILTLPIFFAAIIFAESFKKTPSAALALGSNLIGAITGGLIECLSFVMGLRFLLVVAGLLYFASFICKRNLPLRQSL